MPYNPQTQYRGDEYLYQGMSDAGSGIAKALSTAKQNKDESDMLNQNAIDMSQMKGPDGAPLMDHDTVARFMGASLSAKKAMHADALLRYQMTAQQQQQATQQGQFYSTQKLDYDRLAEQARQRADTVAMENRKIGMEYAQPTADEIQRMQDAGYTYTGQRGRAAFMAQAKQPMTADQLKNFEERTGHTVYNGQVIPLKGAQSSQAPDPQTAINGTVFWNGKTWEQFKAAPGGGGATGVPDPRVLAVQNLDTQRAQLIQEMGKNGKQLTDKHNRSILNWGGQTYQDTFTGLDTERQRLLADLQKNQPVTTPTAARQPVSVNAASAAQPQPQQQSAKPLDQATATQFLQQAGGDKAKARALAQQAGYTF